MHFGVRLLKQLLRQTIVNVGSTRGAPFAIGP